MAEEAHRLPRGITPRRYDLRLKVDTVGCTFSGSVDITVALDDATDAGAGFAAAARLAEEAGLAPAPAAAAGAAHARVTIMLHALNLALTAVPTLTLPRGTGSGSGSGGGDDGAVAATWYLLAPASNTLTCAFDVPREAWAHALAARGEHGVTAVLGAAFAAPLGDKITGLYRSAYVDGAGAPAWAAVTQMQATGARLVFPCWDEPGLKAVFAVTVETAARHTVVANMAATSVTHGAAGGGTRVWTFAPTPAMSTYLVGLFMAEFDAVSGATEAGVAVTVYTPPGKGQSGRFALDTAVRCLNFFATRFGVPYALPKCDLVAVDQLAAGAMENWGAVAFRTGYLLVDDAATSMMTRQDVGQIICHELSHQWFGNLTTPEWWSWLGNNESWAQCMEYLATEALFPEWRVFATYNATTAQEGFGAAALATAHAIQVDVGEPGEIDEIFDSVTYDAGSQSVRQLYAYLGAPAFYAGLHTYFRRYAYGCCRTEDLWAVLAATSGKPVPAMMHQFVQRRGFPLLALSHAPRGTGAASASASASPLRLAVTRFIAPWARAAAAWPTAASSGDAFAAYLAAVAATAPGGSSGSSLAAANALRRALEAAAGVVDLPDETESWNIPLAAALPGGSTTAVSLLELHPGGRPASAAEAAGALAAGAAHLASAPGAAGAAWVKLNPQHAFYHRTLYEGGAWEAVLGHVTELTLEDRVGLVGDVGACALAGYTHPAHYLRLLWSLRHDTEHAVFQVALPYLRDMTEAAVDDGELHAALLGFTRAYLAPGIAALGWAPLATDGVNTPSLRALLLRTAVDAGDEAVAKRAASALDAYFKGVKPHPSLRNLVLVAGAMVGGDAAYNGLLAAHAAADAAGESDEARGLLLALGATRDTTNALRSLAMAVGGVVKPTEIWRLLAAVGRNHWVTGLDGESGAVLAWRAVRDNWASLAARLGGVTFQLPNVVTGPTAHLSGLAAHDEVRDFFASHPHDGAERAVAEALEGIRQRAWQTACVTAAKPALLATIAACV